MRKERISAFGALRIVLILLWDAACSAALTAPIWLGLWWFEFELASSCVCWNAVYVAPLVFFLRPIGEASDPITYWIVRGFYDWPLHAVVLAFGHKALNRTWRLNRLATPLWHGVLLGSLPFEHDIHYLLSKFGVRLVVNTCLEWPGHPKQYSRAGMQQVRVPTLDGDAPTAASVAKCLDEALPLAEQHASSTMRLFDAKAARMESPSESSKGAG